MTKEIEKDIKMSIKLEKEIEETIRIYKKHYKKVVLLTYLGFLMMALYIVFFIFSVFQ